MVTSPYIAELKEHPSWGGMGWDIGLALAATADREITYWSSGQHNASSLKKKKENEVK
jgi:hypothetical protein